VDSAKCWPETGYRKGVASPVCVTRLEGMLVECGTAALFLQMKSAAAQQGVKLRIVSGFRSMKQQQTLHACYQQGKCPQAAKPGYSHHQDGLALDLNTKERGVYEWLARSAAAFGFRRTVASEPWHWERYPGPVDTRAVCS
jgi:LAS superfamily LD-carboxypeptidase LdcB